VTDVVFQHFIQTITLTYDGNTVPEHVAEFALKVEVSNDGATWYGASAGQAGQVYIDLIGNHPTLNGATFYSNHVELQFIQGNPTAPAGIEPEFPLGANLESHTDTSQWWTYGQPDISLFNVIVNGQQYQVISALIDDTVVLTLDRAIPDNAVVSVTYNAPAGNQITNVIQDWTGNDAIGGTVRAHYQPYGFTTQVLSGAQLGGNSLSPVHEYANNPVGSDLGAPLVTSVSIDGRQATLVLEGSSFNINPSYNSQAVSGTFVSYAYSKKYWTVTVDVPNGVNYTQGQQLTKEQFVADNPYLLSLKKSVIVSSDGVTDAQTFDLYLDTAHSAIHLSDFVAGDTARLWGNDSFIGDAYADIVDSGAGDDTINGAGGDDTITGGSGNDVIDGGLGVDTANYLGNKADYAILRNSNGSWTVSDGVSVRDGTDALTNVEKLQFADQLFTLPSANIIVGTSGNDTLNGTLGADDIYGMGGNDALNGGLGNDNYYLDATLVGNVTISDTAGNDAIYINTSGLSYKLDNDSVELSRGGTGNTNLTMEIFHNGVITNTYNINNEYSGTQLATNTAIETVAVSGQGNHDVSFIPVSILTLLGGYTSTAANQLIVGGSANETLTASYDTDDLYGGAGNDTLIGSSTNDKLSGGLGIDTFNITAGNSKVGDLGYGGADILKVSSGATASVDIFSAGWVATSSSFNNGIAKIHSYGYTVNLSAISSGNGFEISNESNVAGASLTGSGLADTIVGGVGNDTLNGSGGADTLIGGAGNDTYVVDSTTDTITELTNGGTDLVQSSVTFSLASIANVENLTLTGTSAINGTGNSLNNTLTGNSGNNILDGGTGTDTLIGGAGNDTYVVDSTTDTITELSNGGTDLVQSSVTFSLSSIAKVENLTLTGTSAINGTGNSLNNTLTGNTAANSLSGGAGNDTIIGGKGADSLTGGTGSDTFIFSAGDSGQTSNYDRITDFAKGAVGTGDLIDYSSNLTIGGSAATATSTQAAINMTSAIATFATGSGTTLTDALGDVATKFTAATNSQGEFALFQVNRTGDYYVFISDGTAGVTANDVVIDLVGITTISQIDLTGGNLTIVG
jgi:Ca2+-binding RTX toxin-like protein